MDNINQFVVNPQNTDVQISQNKYFTLFGMQDYIDDEGNTCQKNETPNTFAKIINDKYLVKIGINNTVYNPIGMFSENQPNKILSKIGKKEFNFKRVNKKVFDLYTSFLRTKNLAWLNNANRELL